MSDANFDMALDDLPDLPANEAFLNGTHLVQLTLSRRIINDKQAVEAAMELITTVELEDDTQVPQEAGTEGSVLYFISTDFGGGKLKNLAAMLTGAGVTASSLEELCDAVQQLEVVVVTKRAKNKTDPDNPYMDIVNLGMPG